MEGSASACTAFARPEDRLRALRAGFQAHLPKPVDQNELLWPSPSPPACSTRTRLGRPRRAKTADGGGWIW
jgi:hypothetical protein